jgi:hypothetical protein
MLTNYSYNYNLNPVKGYRRVYRWNKQKFLFNVLVLIVAVSILLISFSSKTRADQTPRSVIIKNGDTLWKIAEAIRPEQDPRITIESIRDANQLKTVTVQPGQKVLVP